MKTLLITALTLFAISVPAAFASGVLVPKDKSLPPLAIKHQRVEIDVQDGVANAKIEQVFQNSVSRDLEAVFVFPLPKGAAVSDFAMHINGKRMSGEIVGKDQARGIYQDIVRRMKDPGLLEHLGNDMFKVSVYPIKAHGELRIEISYSQPLEYDGGLYKLVYPLKTGEKASQTLEDFTVGVRLSSTVALKNIYSPSHKVGINRKGDHHATIGFEEDRSTLDRDFVLYYGVSKKAFGLNMLTYAESKKDGYFMMMISPDVTADDDQRVERDVVFVMDTSGSMRGEKIEQAREALKYCVGKLADGDRFNVVRFSTDVELFDEELLEVNKKNRKEALEFVSELRAGGGTAISEALETSLGLQKGKRPFTVVFLTDGKPTIGESDPEKILESVGKLADAERIRLFVFGVGENLNTHLLDRISGENGGTSQYIRGEEKIDQKVASFYNKISFPMLSHPSIEVDGVKVRDLHPRNLPDLFAGEQITLFGRYVGNGDHAVRLSGEVNGEKREFVYECSLPKKSIGSDFIPRLWATRRVGFLLDEIRLRGENGELRDEVVALSSEFGIVTPYTSYLVLESKGDYAKHGITLNGASNGKPGGEVADSVREPSTAAEAFGTTLRSRGQTAGAGSKEGKSVDPLAYNDGAKADDRSSLGGHWYRGHDKKSEEEANTARSLDAGEAPSSGRRKDQTPAATAPVAIPLFNAVADPKKPAEAGGPDADLAALVKRRDEFAEKVGAESLKQSEGADAIDIAGKIREYREADAPVRSATKSAAMRHLGGKIFYRINGIWTDRNYKKDLKATKLTYASDNYLDFLEKHPGLNKFFALGEQVIVVLDDGSAVIVEADAP
jgi:Ca-activated chloride channel family protein